MNTRVIEVAMFFLFALAGFWLLALSVNGGLSSRDADFQPHSHKPRRGGVASLDARCSRIGKVMLERAGNAADAMIATQFCLGVIGMHLTGIGGGGFMLVRAPDGTYEFIDFRETAPAASFETMYNNDISASEVGGLASGVPGELRGLEYLHNKYGSLPWKDLIQPSIDLARNGFTVGQDLNYYLDYIQNDALFLSPPWALDFAPTAIRENGVDAFYTGAIALATIAALNSQNGTMTLADLSSYKVVVRKPKSITYRGYRLTSGGAPSGGVVALSILKTFEGYEGVSEPSMINLTTHRLDEAMRLGYGARTQLGDPAFVDGMDAYQDQILSDSYAAKIRARIIDEHTQPIAAYNPDGIESLETPGTSHVSIADATGMAVSLTSTVNLLFGSQLMVPETGIIMNNEMNDFSIPNSTNAFGFIPSPANFIKPGKRPLSSITPIIVEYLNNNTLLNDDHLSVRIN